MPKIFQCFQCKKESSCDWTNAIYCSKKCAADHRYDKLIAEWKITGKTTRVSGTAGLLRKYFFKKQDGKCAGCNNNTWRDKPITLELEHKDGNSDNNVEDNLELLCPNCHSQSPTYKAKNIGNGRHYRRQLYAEGKSF